MILSDQNPYYFSGECAKGIGSPHTYTRFIWPMALAMQGLTSDSMEEKLKMLERIAACDAGTDLVHESFHVDHPDDFTRPWFSWANSVNLYWTIADRKLPFKNEKYLCLRTNL